MIGERQNVGVLDTKIGLVCITFFLLLFFSCIIYKQDFDCVHKVKCELSEVGLLSRIVSSLADSDDDTGVLFMALMAHDTTKI